MQAGTWVTLPTGDMGNVGPTDIGDSCGHFRSGRGAGAALSGRAKPEHGAQARQPFRSTWALLQLPNAAEPSAGVHWRYSCSTFLRQSFVEWVPQTITWSCWAKTL